MGSQNEEPPPDSALMYRHHCNVLSLQLFAHLFEIVLLNFALTLMCCAVCSCTCFLTICLTIEIRIHSIWFCHAIFHGGVCFHYRYWSAFFKALSSEFHTATLVPRNHEDFGLLFASRMEFFCSYQIFNSLNSVYYTCDHERRASDIFLQTKSARFLILIVVDVHMYE